jgi:hypothetical protein
MLLTPSQVLQQHAIRTERIRIFDTEDEVIVRALPTHVIERAPRERSPDAYIFVNAVVDESGARYWTDEQAAEVADKVAPDVVQLVSSKAYALSTVNEARANEIKKNLKALAGEGTGG